VRCALVLLFALGTSAVNATEILSVDRLVEDPALSGPSPRLLKLSPDGQRVTFLRGKDDNQSVSDLWEYHVPSRQTRLLVDSASLGGGAEQLSDEEKARRERQRIAGTSGIVEYQWSADGKQLLFPVSGSLFVYRVGAKPEDVVKQLTRAEGGFATDPKFSPKARYVSFVRVRALVAVRVEDGSEIGVRP